MQITVEESGVAAADTPAFAAVVAEDDDLVVAAIGDGPGLLAAGPAQGFYLTGKFKGPVAVVRRHTNGGRRGRGQLAGLFDVLDHFSDAGDQQVRVGLAGHVADDPALGVDDNQSRPGADAVIIPQDHLRVVDDGMADAVPFNGAEHVYRITFGIEFR